MRHSDATHEWPIGELPVKSAVAIRLARPEDLPAIQALLMDAGLCVEGVAYDGFTGVVLVAEDGGQMVGVVQMLPAQPVSILTEVCVAQAYIGQGLGSRLLQAAELCLQVMGFSGAWWTATDRPWSQRVLDAWPGTRRLGEAVCYVTEGRA